MCSSELEEGAREEGFLSPINSEHPALKEVEHGSFSFSFLHVSSSSCLLGPVPLPPARFVTVARLRAFTGYRVEDPQAGDTDHCDVSPPSLRRTGPRTGEATPFVSQGTSPQDSAPFGV